MAGSGADRAGSRSGTAVTGMATVGGTNRTARARRDPAEAGTADAGRDARGRAMQEQLPRAAPALEADSLKRDTNNGPDVY
jgi:hypothetical protein